MFLMSKYVANGMKIIPGQMEAVSTGDMSKLLCYVSEAFSLIF